MTRLKAYILYIAAFAATLVGCSGGKTSDTRPLLTVSIEPERKILEEIAGEDYKVVTILGNGASPESYDPTISQIAAASDSKAYFTLGMLPFEQRLAASLPESVKIVDVGQGIDHVTGTHSHGEEDHHADPHVWTSLPNAITIAQNMAQALTALDPSGAEAYADRLATFTSRIDSLHQATAQKLATTTPRAFAIWHPSLSYYARDYGLHQLVVGQEGKEMSVGNMRDIIEEARADSVKVLFFQKEYDSRHAAPLNAEIGSRLVEINPMAYEWEAELNKITDELTK